MFPAPARAGSTLGLVFLEEGGSAPALVCRPRVEDALLARSAGETSGRYGSQRQAREALRVLATHTLLRPRRARRLFVEAYFMRALVEEHRIASAARGSPPDGEDSWIDPRLFLERAVAFADSLAASQSALGYWDTGYEGTYVADMAVATALFAALDPLVDAARRERYLAAAGLFLPSGALGIGWRTSLADLLEAASRGTRAPSWRAPYLVSSALAGVELHAWLARHRSAPAHRERARAALEFTLSQLQPDGSLPSRETGEGRLLTAAYVQEGWMAAEALLADPEPGRRLCDRLQVHVAWLLREQRDDGTWDGGSEGEFARTPAILDFLVWYDRRCGPGKEVLRAVRRGSSWTDARLWDERGLFGGDEHHEVLRAILGRALAALAAEQPVY
jgi:hypothetical protein